MFFNLNEQYRITDDENDDHDDGYDVTMGAETTIAETTSDENKILKEIKRHTNKIIWAMPILM